MNPISNAPYVAPQPIQEEQFAEPSFEELQIMVDTILNQAREDNAHELPPLIVLPPPNELATEEDQDLRNIQQTFNTPEHYGWNGDPGTT